MTKIIIQIEYIKYYWYANSIQYSYNLRYHSNFSRNQIHVLDNTGTKTSNSNVKLLNSLYFIHHGQNANGHSLFKKFIIISTEHVNIISYNVPLIILISINKMN